MTAKEMIPAVGATVGVECGELVVTCQVLDVKMSYGQVRLMVTPADGCGQCWIQISRLRKTPDEAHLADTRADRALIRGAL
jgi:hypothetical protein